MVGHIRLGEGLARGLTRHLDVRGYLMLGDVVGGGLFVRFFGGRC